MKIDTNNFQVGIEFEQDPSGNIKVVFFIIDTILKIYAKEYFIRSVFDLLNNPEQVNDDIKKCRSGAMRLLNDDDDPHFRMLGSILAEFISNMDADKIKHYLKSY